MRDSIFCRSFADASLGDACIPNAPCSPPGDPCATGYMICAASGTICEVTGRLPQGAPCGGGYTCAADGTCTVCTEGLVCSTGNPCTMGHVDCGSGTPVCVPDMPVDGMPCGTAGVCGGGLCSECIDGLVCRTGDPCRTGRTRCLDESTTVCEPDAELPPGVGCAPGLACSGDGECDVCVEGAVCSTGNPCTIGRTDCGSGMPVCVEGDPVPGMGCGTSGVCGTTGECSECVDGIACPTGNPCTTGVVDCSSGVAVCTVASTLPAGVRCGVGLACDGAGNCNACVPGETCTTLGCQTGTISCATGSPVCVPSGPAPAGAECRPRAHSCDVAEVCDGSGAPCPPDALAPAGTACIGGGTCDGMGTCVPFCVPGAPCTTSRGCEAGTIDCSSGSPVCVGSGAPEPAGTECRASASECDAAETCDGASLDCPADAPAAAGTTCSAGVCDGAGACVACSPGAPCTTANPCEAGTLDCSTGAPVCVPSGPAAMGTTCRPSAGPCDVAETCDGATTTCPPDGFDSTTICRPAAGPCDAADACDGSGAACPADAPAPAGTPCGVDRVCDATGACIDCVDGAPCSTGRGCEIGRIDCSGGTPACVPAGPQPAGFVCRPSAGTCDPEETCDGASLDCPADVLTSAGTECRASAGVCDPAETCTGSSPSCPPDARLPAGTECRASAGGCDPAESCDGTAVDCPPDVLQPAGAVCRPVAGVCDVPEQCDGSSPACPPDAFQPSSLVCRPAVDGCDVAESCTGAAAACPANGFTAAGTSCGPDLVCDGMGSCVTCTQGAPCSTGRACEIGAIDCSTGAPVCLPVGLVAAGIECRAPAGPCDMPEVCTGSAPDCPPDLMLGSGTVCRAPAGPCDAVETCDGVSPSCPLDARVPSGTVCNPSLGPCDPAEVCDGTSIGCPPPMLAPAGTVCRAPVDLCDAPEVCSGVDTTCPPDQTEPAGTVCRPAVDVCDLPELCPGGTTACPTDVFAPLGTTCPAGVCDGSGGCGSCAGICPIRPNATTTCMGVCGYTCNPGFDDCNTAPADGCEVHLITDPLHCGGCGNACPIPPNATRTCASSTCGYACNPSFADCNASGADGCEIDTANDPANCGGCGNSCPTPANSTRLCAAGTCDYTCNGAFGDCNGSATDGCEIDTSVDLSHCGACGNVCPTRPNSSRTCTSGSCGYTCDPSFGDCNGLAPDGCETDLRSTPLHCGACGNACPTRANATSTCTSSTCGYTCNPGFDDCNGSAADGCERDLNNDPAHCGSCGFACPTRPNASPICTSGSCGYSCNPGYADCNGDPTDGCEVFTGGDVNNCGMCGNVCPTPPASSPTCSGGTCGFTCNAGFGNCNGVAADGCETSLIDNLTHCGACGNTCPDRPGSSPVCAGTTCTFTCDPGFSDCNGVVSDGCESFVASDPNNCGGCGNSCPSRPNSTRFCASSTCGYNCVSGFGDCNGAPSDGCEVNLNTSPSNCGACGFVCNLPNANEICSGGSCAIGSCIPPYHDVDGNPTNGCECADDGWPSSCGAASYVGSFPSGGGTSRSGKIVPAGDSDWFVVDFPASGQPGVGRPSISLTVNEGGVFRFAVRGSCSGSSLTCESGGPTNLLDYEFWDDEALPGPNRWLNPPTRMVSWPTTVYVEVYRINGGPSCANYTISFSR